MVKLLSAINSIDWHIKRNSILMQNAGLTRQFAAKSRCAPGEKSNNKASPNHWNLGWQWPLGGIYISVPGRNDVYGKQLSPLCFVKILSVWSVNPDAAPLGQAGEGNMSHNRMGLRSKLPFLWPMTIIGFKGRCNSASLGAVSVLIVSSLCVEIHLKCR